MENWKTDIQDWTRLNKDLVNFYLSQAETHLKSNIELSDRITLRGTWLLSVIVPITTIITGFVLNHAFLKQTNPNLLYIASASLLPAIACLIMLAVLVGVRKWMSPGGQPKEILTSNMIDTELETEKQYVAVVLGEVEAIQAKIDFTKQINLRRLNILRFVVWLIVATFLAVAFFVFCQVAFFI